MIVLDEQLNDERISEVISKWYPGKVIPLQSLRPNTVIKDDAVPSILLQQNQPTFVTINYADFWLKMPAHSTYCMVCFKFTLERKLEIASRLRDLLNLPQFDTWNRRAGKIISIAEGVIRYYE